KTVAALEAVSLEKERATASLLREQQRAKELEMTFQQAREAVELLVHFSETELADAATRQNPVTYLPESALDYCQRFLTRCIDVTGSQSDLAPVRDRVQVALDELSVVREESFVLAYGLGMCALWSPVVQDDLGLDHVGRQKVAGLCRQWSDDVTRIGEEFRDR